MVSGQSILDLDSSSDMANAFRKIAEVIDHG
jgi:hypothetical protein